MKLFHFLLINIVLQLVFSHNLRNLILTGDSPKYQQLAEAAKETFYQLYNITIDFKNRNFITYDDNSNYYRIVIDEYDNRKFELRDKYIIIKSSDNQLEYPYIPPVMANLNFTIFGREYNLYEEYRNFINVIVGVTKNWEVAVAFLYKNNVEKEFHSYIKYSVFNLNKDGYANGSFSIEFEDKDDSIEIEDTLYTFWQKNEQYIPQEDKLNVKRYAELTVNAVGFWHYRTMRREKLVNAAVKTFHQLYNTQIDFQDSNVVTYNDDDKYYKVLIEEYPQIYEVLDITYIYIKNGRFMIPDNFPSDLTFKIFGRSYNLKQEYQSIGYLLAAAIENGMLTLYTNDINNFKSEIRYRCDISRINEDNKGMFEVHYEDKDDKLTIEDTLNTFWSTYKNKIPSAIIVDVKLAAEFVVTTFGIWHNIANRYDKIVKAANNTIFQVFNLSIDFGGRYIVELDNEKFFIRITIDEFPEIPKKYETSFNISGGRVSFEEIPYEPDAKFEIFEQSLDLEKEYKSIANMFGAGIRYGIVYLYNKAIDPKVTQMRLKCFVNSESGDTYGAFEISLEDKNDRQTIIEALEKYWKELEKYTEFIKNKLEYIANFVGEVVGFKDKFIKAIKNPTSSSSMNLKVSLISLLILFIF